MSFSESVVSQYLVFASFFLLLIVPSSSLDCFRLHINLFLSTITKHKKSNREQHKNCKLCEPGSSQEPKGYLCKLLSVTSSRAVITSS